MKSRNRFLSIILVFCLTLSVFVGCGPKTDSGSNTAISATDQGTTTREIVDMAGRTVEIPTKIDKVFPVSTVSAIYLYTMDPERLLGWNYELNDLEKEIILPEYHDLPILGMGDSISYEAIIAAAPQIALNVGSGDEASIADADKLSESLGIPVLIVSDAFEDTAKVYRFLGELLDNEERGEELAAYVDETFNKVADTVIPEEEKVTVYYGNGEQSLETAPSGSMHSEIIDFVGAKNIADLEVESGTRIQISAEQLLAWNPDYIIVNGEPKADFGGDDAKEALLKSPDYVTLTAVKNEDVYGAPNTPFSWVDRPPGPNRVIGVRWLAELFYPDYYDYEINTEVKEFYKMFYHMDITDEQMADLLGL